MSTEDLDQIEQLKPVVCKYDLFKPVYCTNFSVVLKNRFSNSELFGKTEGQFCSPLNYATRNLAIFCGAVIEDSKARFDSKTFHALSAALGRWKLLNEKGNYFLTYPPAKQVIEIIKQSGFPFENTLKASSLVSKSFNELVPVQLKAIIKLSLYVKAGELNEVLIRFIAWLNENRPIFNYVEKIEIPRKVFRTGRTDLPLFTITINPFLLTNPHSYLINMVVDKLDTLTKHCPPMQTTTDQFNLMMRQRIAIVQGYNNYKHFLSLTGQLNTIYNSEVNYAFLSQEL